LSGPTSREATVHSRRERRIDATERSSIIWLLERRTRHSTGAPNGIAVGYPSRCARRRPVHGIPFGNTECIPGYASVYSLPVRRCREVVARELSRVLVFGGGSPPLHCAARLGLSVLRRPAHPWLPLKRHRSGALPLWRGVAPGLFVLRGVGVAPAPRCTLQRGLSVLRRPAHPWLPLKHRRRGTLTQLRDVAPGLCAHRGVGVPPAPSQALQSGLSVLRRPAHRRLPLKRHGCGPLAHLRCVATTYSRPR